MGRGHDCLSCSRMSCSDENRLSPNPTSPTTNEEKCFHHVCERGMVGCGWQSGPGFMVREAWVSIPALYLNFLTFCIPIGKVETRIWLISWWGLGWQSLYQGLVITGMVLRTLFINSFILTTNPIAEEEPGAEGDDITCPKSQSKWWTGIQSGVSVILAMALYCLSL